MRQLHHIVAGLLVAALAVLASPCHAADNKAFITAVADEEFKHALGTYLRVDESKLDDVHVSRTSSLSDAGDEVVIKFKRRGSSGRRSGEKEDDVLARFDEAAARSPALHRLTYRFDMKATSTPLIFGPDHTGGSIDNPTQSVCPDAKVQPPNGLFRRWVCHILPDQRGRRRRKPKPGCPYAFVGIRGLEVVRNAVDAVEYQLGMEPDDISVTPYIVHNLMHQGFVYGDEDGTYDFSSGYYCGQQADQLGLNFYGWVCQDPEPLLAAYTPITNDTIALDNWIPQQYHLVDRKFDCKRLWESEQIVAEKYDSCTHPETADYYRTLWHNCHTYVNAVVDVYDRLEALAIAASNSNG